MRDVKKKKKGKMCRLRSNQHDQKLKMQTLSGKTKITVFREDLKET